MNKFISVLGLLLCFCVGIQAQTEQKDDSVGISLNQFKKGDIRLGFDFGYGRSSKTAYQIPTNLSGEYFLSKRSSLLAKLNYNFGHKSLSSYSYNIHGLGGELAFRSYFGKREKLKFFTEIGIGYWKEWNKVTRLDPLVDIGLPDRNLLQAHSTFGMNYHWNDRLSFELSLNMLSYEVLIKDKKINFDDYSGRAFGNFKLGIKYRLGKKKSTLLQKPTNSF